MSKRPLDLSRMFADNNAHDMRPLEVVMNISAREVSALGERYAGMRRENDEFFAEEGVRLDAPEFPIPGAEWAGMIEVVREIGAALEHGERPGLPQELLDRLTRIARHPSPDYRFVLNSESILTPLRVFYLEEALLVQAIRCLGHILWSGGKVKLLRCPVPAPGHSDPKMKCDRYFVSGARHGRPKKYCSAACRSRSYYHDIFDGAPAEI